MGVFEIHSNLNRHTFEYSRKYSLKEPKKDQKTLSESFQKLWHWRTTQNTFHCAHKKPFSKNFYLALIKKHFPVGPYNVEWVKLRSRDEIEKKITLESYIWVSRDR